MKKFAVQAYVSVNIGERLMQVHKSNTFASFPLIVGILMGFPNSLMLPHTKLIFKKIKGVEIRKGCAYS